MEGVAKMRFIRKIGSLAAAVLLCMAMLTGCASDQVASKTASSADPLAAQARHLRSSQGDGDFIGTGLSSKARDIERDLNGTQGH
jgi:hypothetical protein